MRFIRTSILAVVFSTISIFNLSANYNDSIKISLITCFPGPQIYEVFGHTAIRVDSEQGDIVFNYGIFDFNSPNFIYRFVKGLTDYKLAYYPFDYFLGDYVNRNSRVVEQVLNLDKEHSLYLLQLLQENAEPANRTYRYNYIYDNCSTRPRDLLEKVTAGTIEYPAPQDTLTFRDEMHFYNKNYPWFQFGIDMVLGPGLDYMLTHREQMFVPMVLMNACAEATYTSNGKRIPLVSQTIILNDVPADAGSMGPTPWYLTPVTVSIIIFLITITITIYDYRRQKVTKIFDSLLFTVMGVAGIIIFFLIFISTHAATSPNMLAFWLNPFCFIPAIFIWIKQANKLLLLYHFTNFAVLLILLAAWYWLPQVGNIAFFPLILCSVLRSFNYILISRKCERNDK